MHRLQVSTWLLGYFVLFMFIGVQSLRADPSLSQDNVPVIAIIIDDLGDNWSRGKRAVDLPGAVACAILPHRPYAKELARTAHAHNKEVILHLPMESVHGHSMGPGGLTRDMDYYTFVQALQRDLAAVPHVSGINNHMGSLLTQHPDHMLWLMHTLGRHGNYYFVDSRTTSNTVAGKVADQYGIPSLQRDVFLDNDVSAEAIDEQFNVLLRLARERGTALAIGHPHVTTLAVLQRRLSQLSAEGVRLVPVSELIQLRKQRRQSWQASLSPSHRVAKNSKRSPSSTSYAVPISTSPPPAWKTAR